MVFARPLRLVAPLLLLAACGEVSSPADIESIDLRAAASRMVEGSSVALEVRSSGRVIGVEDVRWHSLDSATVSVENGTARGVAPGVTFVVVEVGRARDSVRLNVRFAQVGEREVAVRVQGIADAPARAVGTSRFEDRLSGADGDQTWISAQEVDPSDPTDVSSNFWIAFAGDPAVGESEIAPFDLSEGRLEHGIWEAISESHGAYYVRWDAEGPGIHHFFLPVDHGELEIDVVQMPSAPGDEPGVLRGSVSFEAGGLVVQNTSIIRQVADTTVRLYAEFDTELAHWTLGSGMLESTGGNFTAANMTAGPKVWDRDGSLQIFLDYADPPALEDELWRGLEGKIRLNAPGAGAFAVDSVGPEAAADPGSAPTWARLEGSYRPNHEGSRWDMFSRTGTVDVTTYQPATLLHYGRIAGRAEIELLVFRDGVAEGSVVTMVAEFDAPIYPLNRECGTHKPNTTC